MRRLQPSNSRFRSRVGYLTAISKGNPKSFFRALPPKTNEYARLLKEKQRPERQIAKGGWGPTVPGKSLKPGATGITGITGGAVIALRNRLISMGFMKRSLVKSYDGKMQKAAQQFQLAHGLAPDGVVVPLEQQVPVHIMYRTAFTRAKGHMQYRRDVYGRDVYGRDANIWKALAKAGVSQPAVQR